MNKNIKYLVESFLDDEDEVVDTDVQMSKYAFYPSTKQELQENILELLNNGITDLNIINVSKVTDMNSLFKDLVQGKGYRTKIGKIDISKWDVSDVKNMNYMFDGCKDIEIDIRDWKVSRDCQALNTFYRAMKVLPENTFFYKNIEEDKKYLMEYLHNNKPLTILGYRIIDKSGHMSHLGEVLEQLIMNGPTTKKELWELCGFPEGYYGTWWNQVKDAIFYYIGNRVYFKPIKYWF